MPQAPSLTHVLLKNTQANALDQVLPVIIGILPLKNVLLANSE